MRDFYVTPPVRGALQLNTYAKRQFGYVSLATVNAKNSFGGYTGRNLYVAFFIDADLQNVVKAEYVSTETGFWGAFGQGKHLLTLVDEEEWARARRHLADDG